ncbi:hypothetical protein AB0M43_07135 [Longispora sp. NPDC051575]|uniref:hypothetical protein n=1 Tax=Longispora sp. NPDC051575 TaxID=3154943 RepID=UPI0034292AFC
MSTLFRRLAGAALTAAVIVMFPVAANASGPTGYGFAQPAQAVGGPSGVDNVRADAPTAPRAQGAPLAAATWYYHIESSCRGYESSIRRGANYWGGAVETQSGGTPVGCVSGYVQGCGGGTTVVGCNWNMGGRIALSFRVNDFALLAAHEFGHNWYGHSASGCMSWRSSYEVMRTHSC